MMQIEGPSLPARVKAGRRSDGIAVLGLVAIYPNPAVIATVSSRVNEDNSPTRIVKPVLGLPIVA
jgi:hypothetical protein